MDSTILFVPAPEPLPGEALPPSMQIITGLSKKREELSKQLNSLILVIVDLDREKNLTRTMMGIRESINYREIPFWGLTESGNARSIILFRALGGTRVLRNGEWPRELANFTPHEVSSREELGRFSPSEPDRLTLNHLNLTVTAGRMIEESQKTVNLSLLIEAILRWIMNLIQPDMAVIFTNGNQYVENYVLPNGSIFREDYRDFGNFCLNDVFNHFPGVNLESIGEHFFLGERADFDKIRIDPRKISSYFYMPLVNSNGVTEATLHLGHLQNNYFSERMIGDLRTLVHSFTGRFYYAFHLHLQTLRQEKLYNIFQRFVPQEIIPELIMRESQKDVADVEEKEVAVLFSDIRSFTTITEKNGAQDVVDFLNRHFNVMVGIIKKHGGSIDKFIGDAIVAIFGIPSSFPDNALRAVKAAREMIAALPRVDCSGVILQDNRYAIGIGVHEGRAIVGNVGTPDKLDYTAIGNVIAVAEELEGLTKQYKVPILLSEEAAGKTGKGIPLREVDKGLFTPREDSHGT